MKSKAVVVAAASAVMLLGGTTVASAAAVPVEIMGTAPSCVKADLDDSGGIDNLVVTNKCDSYLRLKVVLAKMSDMPCAGYEPNYKRSYRWAFPGRFDGIVTC